MLSHAMTWMNLEDIRLNEISKSQKDKYCMIYLYEISKVFKFIETESKMAVTRGWGEGEIGIII